MEYHSNGEAPGAAPEASIPASPPNQYPAAAGLFGKFGGLPTYSRALSATLLA